MKSSVGVGIMLGSAAAYEVPVIQPMSSGNFTAPVTFAKQLKFGRPRAVEDYEVDCYLPLDVMFLQDTTGSFFDDLPHVVSQLPDLMEYISERHPDTHFGVAQFRDKPFQPLGLPTDFCYRLPTNGFLQQDTSATLNAYKSLFASGGMDLPEAQYQALIDVTLDSAVGYRPVAQPGVLAQPGEVAARIVIMNTDAKPHDPRDCRKYNPRDWPNCPRNLPPNSGTISTSDINYECIYQDYPSCYQAKDVLVANDVRLVIMTPEDPKIIPVWRWVNDVLLEQPEDYYQFIQSDSSDFQAGVIAAIASVVKGLCPPTTSTTPRVTTPQQVTETAFGPTSSVAPTESTVVTTTAVSTIGTSEPETTIAITHSESRVTTPTIRIPTSPVESTTSTSHEDTRPTTTKTVTPAESSMGTTEPESTRVVTEKTPATTVTRVESTTAFASKSDSTSGESTTLTTGPTTGPVTHPVFTSTANATEPASLTSTGPATSVDVVESTSSSTDESETTCDCSSENSSETTTAIGVTTDASTAECSTEHQHGCGCGGCCHCCACACKCHNHHDSDDREQR